MIRVNIYEGNPGSRERLIEKGRWFNSWATATSYCVNVAPMKYGPGNYWFIIAK